MVLEVHAGSDPIAGRLIDERGARSFSGWLELAYALQAALDPPPVSDELQSEPSVVSGPTSARGPPRTFRAVERRNQTIGNE